jgi:hypothetical protein
MIPFLVIKRLLQYRSTKYGGRFRHRKGNDSKNVDVTLFLIDSSGE